MSTIRETTLPGVGRKFQVETTNGDRLVIVIHDDGTRELYHFTRKNPDRVASVVTLADSEPSDPGRSIDLHRWIDLYRAQFRGRSCIRYLTGFAPKEMLIVAGITTISSSAIVAKILFDYRRTANPETELILGIT